MKPLAALLLLAASAAQAHITLEQAEAEAGRPYKAVLRVGHGCEGSATREIAVTLPAGLRGTKPMPKPGWTLTVQRAPLVSPEAGQGKPVADEVTVVRWTANGEADYLQDAWYDEFSLRAGLPAEPGELWFKVRQVCVKGEVNWADIPSADRPQPTTPAARLKLLPAATAEAGHKH